jgi:D-sedoheptulose 7-phosphate isomerase
MNNITNYLTEFNQLLGKIPVSDIEAVVTLLHEIRFKDQQIFIMGNGGSASTASHFVCDLAKNTRRPGAPRFRVIGLTDNIAILSAYSNDEGYEHAFVEQLESLVRPQDVVIGISASGNSKNVLNAIQMANIVGAKTIGFTGFDGGKLKTMVDINVHIPSQRIGQVEDIHMMLVHMICETLGKMVEEVSTFIRPQPSVVQMSDVTKDLADKLFKGSVNVSDPEIIDPVLSSQALLEKINLELGGEYNLHEMLGRILQLTLESIGAASGTTVVLNENGEVIDGALSYAGQIQPAYEDCLDDIVRHGLAGWVLANRQAALVDNTQNDPRWLQRTWEQTSPSRSAISVPLMTKDRVVGVVTLVRNQPSRFTLQDLALLTAIMVSISYSFEASVLNGKI